MRTRSDTDIAAVFQQIEEAQKQLIQLALPEPADTGILVVPSEFAVTRTTNFSSHERDVSAWLERSAG
jgi:hypothetical protein